MPTHMRERLQRSRMQDIALAEPFSFTKGCRTMKIAARPWMDPHPEFGTMLFDVESDPAQQSPLDDPETEQRMIELMTRLMKESDSPPEQFERLGLV